MVVKMTEFGNYLIIWVQVYDSLEDELIKEPFQMMLKYISN